MITYSELIQTGIFIVALVGKSKSLDFTYKSKLFTIMAANTAFSDKKVWILFCTSPESITIGFRR